MQSALFFSVLAAFLFTITTASHKCWLKVPKDKVFVDTLGAGHVQMGFISYLNDLSGPSGQPEITASKCQKFCDDMGPDYCAAVQIFLCKDAQVNWCNLLTPVEYNTAKGNPVTIHPEAPGSVVGAAYYRGTCRDVKEVEEIEEHAARQSALPGLRG